MAVRPSNPGKVFEKDEQIGGGIIMDPFLARTMVESLSKGINPLTGRVLPQNDSCSNEEIQDALLEVLEHCSIESTEQYLARIKEEKELARKKKREYNAKCYPRGGAAWTSDEEQRLLYLHRQGVNIYQIANILKRTPGSISDRLKKLQSRPIYRSKK